MWMKLYCYVYRNVGMCRYGLRNMDILCRYGLQNIWGNLVGFSVHFHFYVDWGTNAGGDLPRSWLPWTCFALLCSLSWGTGGYLCPNERALPVCFDHEPQLPWTNGTQGTSIVLHYTNAFEISCIACLEKCNIYIYITTAVVCTMYCIVWYLADVSYQPTITIWTPLLGCWHLPGIALYRCGFCCDRLRDRSSGGVRFRQEQTLGHWRPFGGVGVVEVEVVAQYDTCCMIHICIVSEPAYGPLYKGSKQSTRWCTHENTYI